MKNNVVNVILYSLAAAAVVAAYGVAAYFGYAKAKDAEIRHIEFVISTTSTAYADASLIADERLPYYEGYLGAKKADVDLSILEDNLRFHDRLENCECYISHDTTLVVCIEPNEVILDFCRKKDSKTHQYSSATGKIFAGDEGSYTIVGREPLKVYGPAPLDEEHWLRSMINFSKSYYRDPLLHGNIESVTVLEDGSLVLNQKDCPTTVIYGNFFSQKDKLQRYKTYLRALKPTGMEYKSVDVRYSDQLICKK